MKYFENFIYKEFFAFPSKLHDPIHLNLFYFTKKSKKNRTANFRWSSTAQLFSGPVGTNGTIFYCSKAIYVFVNGAPYSTKRGDSVSEYAPHFLHCTPDFRLVVGRITSSNNQLVLITKLSIAQCQKLLA